MTKKYLCGVVSAAVLMGACPTAVFAADLENPLDFRSMTEDAADTDAGWAWDASSQTLTVENLSLTVPQGKLEERAAIYLPDESTVREILQIVHKKFTKLTFFSKSYRQAMEK